MEHSTNASDSDSEDTLSLHYDAVSDSPPRPTPNSPSHVFEFAVVDRQCADLDGFVFAANFKSAAHVRSEDPFFARSESFNRQRIVSRSSRSYSAPSASSSLWSTRSGNGGARHKVLFGIVKMPAEMELSDMRKRQSRRAPAPMFPAETVAARKGGSSWSLVRSLKGRAHFVRDMARASVGCVRLV